MLIRENVSYRKWPKELKIGTGANGIALLKNVPIWYELWRQLNGFPPSLYESPVKEATSAKKAETVNDLDLKIQ